MSVSVEKKELKPKKKKSFFGYILVLWFFILAVLGGGAFFIYATSQGMLGYMPSVEEIANPEFIVASEVISSDNKKLGKYFSENRTPIKYKDLPEHLIDALLASEDERFLAHSGIDKKALMRAIARGGRDGGGSTITQQTAKLLFTGKVSRDKLSRAFQKVKEMIISVELEKTFTKEEIIAIYFNKFDFLYNAKGVEAAAKTYFNKSVSELTLNESATFVGMLKNPWKINPKRSYDLAVQKRNEVLKDMERNGYITLAEKEQEQSKPITLDFNRKLQQQGLSAYYKQSLKKEINKKLKGLETPLGKAYDVYGDGLKVYVTLDSKMQKHAEDAVKKHLTYLQKVFNREHKHRKKAPFYGLSYKSIDNILKNAMKRTGRYKSLKEKGVSEDSILKIFETPTKLDVFTWEGSKTMEMSPMDSIRYHKQILQSGMMSMENGTGFIKAWVGGNNYNHFQYDMVKQGERQVGSTFKPFVYATLLKQFGTSPCENFSGARYSQGGWNPKNSGGGYPGSISLYNALAISMNTVTARLINKVGVQNTIQTARDMGITSKIANNQTIGLGTASLTVHDMVGAYGTFANHGIWTEPVMVLRIEDKNGKVLYDYKPKTRVVFSDEIATIMLELMQGVSSTKRRGTAKRLRSTYKFGKTEIACKTGTTNDNSDGWFIGVTPNLTTGIWVGCENRAAHFRSTAWGQGAVMALPIWAYYMKDVYKSRKDEYSMDDKFSLMDEEDMAIALDCSKYKKTSVGGFFTKRINQIEVRNEIRRYKKSGASTKINHESSTTTDASLDGTNKDLFIEEKPKDSLENKPKKELEEKPKEEAVIDDLDALDDAEEGVEEPLIEEPIG